jgi:UPF0716 protein FxsA
MKALFLIFLVIPLVEIYLLIQIGSIVGAGTTVFLVVFTAMLGAFLVRAQGFSTLGRVQMQLGRAKVPAVEIIEGLFLFVAGALLLTPGFFTDAIGFVFLTPPLRRLIIHGMINRGLFRKFGNSNRGRGQSPDSIFDDQTNGQDIERKPKRVHRRKGANERNGDDDAHDTRRGT